MKKSKNIKILAFLLCLVIFSFAGCTSGDGEMTGYTVCLKTEGGMPIEEIEIRVYKDSKLSDLVWASRTAEDGNVTFSAPKSEKYVAVLGDLPKGYESQKSYSVKNEYTVITPKIVMQKAENIAEFNCGLGDIIPDFSITDYNGKTYQISKLLKEKKAVVLNFWYLNCQPCKMEFPFLEQAYKEYKDDIEVLAINPLDGSDSEISEFANENKLSFPMAVGEQGFENCFKLNAYPTTVIIDRYGNIAMMHKGSITDKETFTKIFGYFVSDSYQQTTVRNISDIK